NSAALAGSLPPACLHVSDGRAPSFAVTRTSDSERGACHTGDCSLREAIEAANALVSEASTITLPAGTYVLSISKRLSMTAPITITGAGSATTIVDGNLRVGVFDNADTGEIDGVTVRRGKDTSGLGGGGIHNAGTFMGTDLVLDGNTTNGQGGGFFNEGTAYLIQSVLRNNTAAGGGGLANTGSISVLGSFTIDGNTSTVEGGGVRNDGVAYLDNTNPPTPPGPPTGGGTISTNHGTSGGGVYNDGSVLLDSSTVTGNGAQAGGGTSNDAFGSVEVRNTILAANTPQNCSGDIMSDGHNIDSGSSCTPTVAGDRPNTDPLLGSLQYNSPGPSFLQTQAPLAGSPALDAAQGCPPPDTDERGVTRPQGSTCDIGAVEKAVPITCGDVNGDGVVNIGDALVVAQFDVGLRRCRVPPFSQPTACNVNGDSACNIGDALRMAQCDVGLVSCAFSCGPFVCQ